MTWRVTRVRASLVLAAWGAAATRLVACPICFQVEDGPVATGVRVAVVVLIGVTLTVLAGFAIFIARFVARAKHLETTQGDPRAARS